MCCGTVIRTLTDLVCGFLFSQKEGQRGQSQQLPVCAQPSPPMPTPSALAVWVLVISPLSQREEGENTSTPATTARRGITSPAAGQNPWIWLTCWRPQVGVPLFRSLSARLRFWKVAVGFACCLIVTD